ncbi:50S ribosomal protein L6 [Salisediminibacterium beveridgei]|uniref:Large ribosomal subunit protein uL6 n=1 Tax=Salisediminibacterium beveridgei TaxID=632773 RepID=A0A1D7QZW4_9BACI|nr:50S ribosomal protein L6 [Salisediminibacterium beveridgei]AOM84545.1 LSU ribosomal protein L6p (L9e) [Salisediminibacterium beveridgei]
MSRIGLKPVEVPSDVEVKLDNNVVTVKGPKGELTRELHADMQVTVEGNEVTVARPSDHKEHRSLHGTTRSMINNMVEGVSKGFEKKLELVGVGYRAQKSGKKLILNVGLSHQVEFEDGNGIEIDVPSNTQITVKGIDKELVGAVASNIRSTRKPEPYKGKGVRYEGEFVRRKEGKTGK